MRPMKGETLPDYTRRFMQDHPAYPEDTRVKVCKQMWALGPYPENPLDAAHAACCSLTKQDIPHVQAAIFVAEPVLAAIWEQMLDRAAEDVSNAAADELGPEWILLLTNELWKALSSAPRPDQVEALRHAAVKVGAFERSYTAVQDLLLQARGKFELEQEAISNILARKPPKQMLRDQMAAVFGPVRQWLVPVVEMWAYKWHWVGEALSLRTASRVQQFRYWNPDDDHTSSFCKWLVNSGRTVTLNRIQHQINAIERAIVQNSVTALIQAWPFLQLRGNETDAEYARLYQTLGLACPPFHWRCRTQLVPVV